MKILRSVKGMLTTIVILMTAAATAQPVLASQPPPLEAQVYTKHLTNAGGREATVEEMIELAPHHEVLEAQFRKQAVQHMLDIVWFKTGTV